MTGTKSKVFSITNFVRRERKSFSNLHSFDVVELYPLVEFPHITNVLLILIDEGGGDVDSARRVRHVYTQIWVRWPDLYCCMLPGGC